MKKYLFICLMAVVGLVMVSCNSNAPRLNKMTIDLAVEKSQWEFDNTVNMFYCHFDVPQLTSDIYNYGEVSVNREYNSGTSKAYQVALPETSYKVEEEVVGDSVTNVYYYAQHIDYLYGPKYVEIFYTISDYFYEDGFKPEAMLFRLQMTY